MNNKKILLGLLLVTIIAQLGISGSMIFQFEDICLTNNETPSQFIMTLHTIIL